jgi:hypothetical protein
MEPVFACLAQGMWRAENQPERRPNQVQVHAHEVN